MSNKTENLKKMINERRDWMEEYKHDHKEPPQQIKLFYDKFNVTIKYQEQCLT